MRKIVCLTLTKKNKEIYQDCLEICSIYTPLIEPVDDDSIFLDLSGCGKTGQLIINIAARIYSRWHTQIKMGLAASKLLARTAVYAQKLPLNKPASYQVICRPEVMLIRILPGKEGAFTGALYLDDFYPLNLKMVKSLTRLGFSRVEEIAAIPAYKLSALLGGDGYLLLQQSQGIDYSPVLGLFPPLQITYPVELEVPTQDILKIESSLLDAAKTTASLLETRHSGCQHIKLVIITNNATLVQDRILSSTCYQAKHLFNILKGLFKQAEPVNSVSGFRVIISEIQPLQLLQENLFSYHTPVSKTRQPIKLENILDNLQTCFPGLVSQGLKVSRREQVLAIWDPWRSFS